MKKIFLLLCISSINFLYPQNNGEVEYFFTYQAFDEKPKDEADKEGKEMARSIAEYAKSHKYLLKFNPEESFYYVEETLPLDGADSFAYKFSSQTFSKGVFYQNLKTGEIINQLTTMGENFLVQNSFYSDWEITTEQKYIGKYNCFKAISKCKGCNNNQEIIAWFTPDIPLSFGPAGYGGLPGLILESTWYKYTLQLKKIHFTNEPIKIEKPTKGIPITAEKLKELQMEKRMQMKR